MKEVVHVVSPGCKPSISPCLWLDPHTKQCIVQGSQLYLHVLFAGRALKIQGPGPHLLDSLLNWVSPLNQSTGDHVTDTCQSFEHEAWLGYENMQPGGKGTARRCAKGLTVAVSGW